MKADNAITINMYGAFDRFNYGDLLFPIVIQKALDERLGEQHYAYYGLIDSDLTRFGGVPTTAIRRRLRAVPPANQKDVFIIAGGEILSTSMYYIHQCLINNDLARKVFSRLRDMFGGDFSNTLSRHLLARELVFPFIIDKSLLPGVSCIIYNTVGGLLSEEDPTLMQQYLRQADYISVRDMSTLERLKDVIPDIKPFLFPDSATLMSKYFPINILWGMINPETEGILNACLNGYICFQISASSYNVAPDVVQKQLTELAKTTGLPVLLLPIGRAPWHHDQKVLRAIQLDARYSCFMPSENTIYDIMVLIAHARLFIGTSLHGIITSMCYSVPYVAINPHIIKVKRYLETWCHSEFNMPIEYSSITETAVKVLDMNIDKLDREHRRMIEKVELNFDAIAQCIQKIKTK